MKSMSYVSVRESTEKGIIQNGRQNKVVLILYGTILIAMGCKENNHAMVVKKELWQKSIGKILDKSTLNNKNNKILIEKSH